MLLSLGKALLFHIMLCMTIFLAILGRNVFRFQGEVNSLGFKIVCFFRQANALCPCSTSPLHFCYAKWHAEIVLVFCGACLWWALYQQKALNTVNFWF